MFSVIKENASKVFKHIHFGRSNQISKNKENLFFSFNMSKIALKMTEALVYEVRTVKSVIHQAKIEDHTNALRWDFLEENSS